MGLGLPGVIFRYFCKKKLILFLQFSPSALFCYIDSKKIPSLDEVKEELFKIKEDVEHLQIKYLKDYENLVTATNKDSITTAECFSSKSNEQRNENCCGKNATKDSSKCCSDESESVKCESGRKTDCCAENSEISGTWTIAQDRKLSDGFSTNVKDRTKGLLETLRKEVEIIEKQLATLIENKICSHLKK